MSFDDHLDNYGDPGPGTSNTPLTPFYADDTVTLFHGDSLDVVSQMDDGSVDCVVTSPPYYGLRDYGTPGQYGLEPSPAEYVETMRGLFAEVRRVLADDGTLWLNIGDSYSTRGGNLDAGVTGRDNGKAYHSVRNRVGDKSGLPDKNLMGIPWRVAFALQDDGWILRNDIIWHKPNAMPESVTDRLSTRHEHLFLFAKSRKYWFDLDAVREPLARPEALDEGIVFGGKNPEVGQRRGSTYGKPRKIDEPWNANTGLRPHTGHRGTSEAGRNPGDVWSITTRGFSEAHFATFPPELPRRCIKAGCKPGGTVLDPFNGSGTTGLAAAQLGRKYVGVDLSADYLELSLRTRLAQPGLLDVD